MNQTQTSEVVMPVQAREPWPIAVNCDAFEADAPAYLRNVRRSWRINATTYGLLLDCGHEERYHAPDGRFGCAAGALDGVMAECGQCWAEGRGR